ncbi:MAG: exodeoxyribonuclease VII large subunit [Bulleidia sp.]
MSRRIIPVSTLVHYLKGSLESDPVLHGVLVEGEISNLRKPYSGHWYFSLKDSRSSISCVMFSSYNRRVSFPVQNGDKVEIRGDVSVYESTGSLQINVSAMRQAGIGDLYARLEELKKKMQEEGLFDEAHKKPLPAYPMDIALVTGNNTAAREDVLITFAKRWPCARITEYPAPVQGPEAPPKIIEALRKADQHQHDVILLVRGGGSIEDLWCFNDENLARVIYDLNTPIVTGIGHEIDFTIADFTADVRANTPTGAVETAVPDIHEVQHRLETYRNRLVSDMNYRIENQRIHLDHLSSGPVFAHPERLYEGYQNVLQVQYAKLMKLPVRIEKEKYRLSLLHHRFTSYSTTCMSGLSMEVHTKQAALLHWWEEKYRAETEQIKADKKALIEHIHTHISQSGDKMKMNSALLDAYSPLKVMARGYSVISKDGSTVSNAQQISNGDHVDIRLSKGSLKAVVEEVYHGREENEI